VEPIEYASVVTQCGQAYLKLLDSLGVDVNTNIRFCWGPCLFKHTGDLKNTHVSRATPVYSGNRANISKIGLLQSALDDACRRFAVWRYKLRSNDRSAYVLGRIDDLLDSRHAERNVHGRDTGKMESFQGHLGAGFPDRLSPNRTNGRSCTKTSQKSSDWLFHEPTGLNLRSNVFD
jgi:hypothetical protein